MRKICIDARFYGVGDTGIGRYVENLIDNLPTDPNIEVVLILHPKNQIIEKLLKFKIFVAKQHPYTFLSLLEMHWLLVKIQPDLLHVPHITVPFLWPGRMILTLHDLIKHYSRGVESSTHSKPIYYLKYLEYLAMVWVSIHRASHIITPSTYWKNELVKKYNVDPTKISVTYEGVANDFAI